MSRPRTMPDIAFVQRRDHVTWSEANVKLSVMQENLARGLSVVSRAVSNRSLPVLTNVLLKTEDGGLKLTATNLEIGITYWVPGKIETDGATSVPARLLTDLVNSLPGGEPIILELGDGETLHIQAGRFESNIKGIPAEDFPTVQTAGERPITRVPQKVLRQALDETAFAAASDEARPILTGVLARFEGDQLTLAAADNYRIAVKTITVLDAVEETSVVIPARALIELSRILADVDDPVSIVLAHSRNQLLFHVEGIDLVTRLIDGQYPNYQSVLPATHATRAVLDRDELLRAVRPAALIAHESANIVKLGVGLEGDPAITVSANAEVGDHIGRVEAAVEGDGTTIAFNARFLADVLTNVDAEQFALELNGPLSPGVFRPIGDDRYVHVVMPLRTTS
ncbi:MAG TPA: DNA polymerase III subunit beta [Candidatus Limnocylindrales bacterium]|nr:DNA polymerase III subunit beta [Candidatus Limnocylindrales bacterium]